MSDDCIFIVTPRTLIRSKKYYSGRRRPSAVDRAARINATFAAARLMRNIPMHRDSGPRSCSTASLQRAKGNNEALPNSYFFKGDGGGGTGALFSPSTERAMAIVAFARGASA